MHNDRLFNLFPFLNNKQFLVLNFNSHGDFGSQSTTKYPCKDEVASSYASIKTLELHGYNCFPKFKA